MQIVDELDLFLARSVFREKEPFPIACFQLKKKLDDRQSTFEDEEKARYGHVTETESESPGIKHKVLEQKSIAEIKIRSKRILGRPEYSIFSKGLLTFFTNCLCPAEFILIVITFRT